MSIASLGKENVVTLISYEHIKEVKFRIDVDCLRDCLEGLLCKDNVFDIFLHINMLIQVIMDKVDEGYSPQRAIYGALYILLQDLGVRDYFTFAKYLDECLKCIEYEVLPR